MTTQNDPKAERIPAGLRESRKSRRTGLTISLYDGELAGLDTDDGRTPWSTVCEEHGTICSHPTLKLARSHLGDPAGWCEDCGTLEAEKEELAIPRAFREYARRTWGWQASDVTRLERGKPDVLAEKIAYWRSTLSEGR